MQTHYNKCRQQQNLHKDKTIVFPGPDWEFPERTNLTEEEQQEIADKATRNVRLRDCFGPRMGFDNRPLQVQRP